jgi:HK97 family phage major capsid protein
MAVSEYTRKQQRKADLEADARVLMLMGTGRTASQEAKLADINDELASVYAELAQLEGEREKQRNAPAMVSYSTTGGAVVYSDRAPALRKVGSGPRYAEMFGGNLQNNGFRDFGEFAAAFNSGMWHPSFQALTTSNDVGTMIPTQWASELWDQSLENEVVRPRCRIEPMTSDTKQIAGFTHSNGTDAPFGISGGWTVEGAEITPDDPQARSILLSAKKLAALVQISNEAAADGTSIDAQLTSALSRGLGWLLDVAFLTGTGAGQPLGVLNASCTITVDKESGQVADTIVYQNLTKMFSRLAPSSVNNAVWVASPTTIPQLLTLNYAIGTSGAAIPVMTNANGSFTILTRPVVFTEKLPALGDKGDIMLCDFTQYVVGLRSEIVVEKSNMPGFTRDTVYYRAKVRADGQPTWADPYTPKYGSTLSPFVTLQAR